MITSISSPLMESAFFTVLGSIGSSRWAEMLASLVGMSATAIADGVDVRDVDAVTVNDE